mmetsp:Transcript_5515/g.8878  ORF Transcript_5515/g.8878 Transcript_5515/m.8878 type:complete len:383 (-) Transcript_5515:1115-2263(-)
MRVDQRLGFWRVGKLGPCGLCRIPELLQLFRRPLRQGHTIGTQLCSRFSILLLERQGGAQGQRFHGNLHDGLVRFRHRVKHGLVARQVIRRHRVEAGEVGVFDDVIQTQAHVVGQTRCVRSVDDAGFQRGKDLGKVHHDGRRAEFLKDFGFHAGGRAELPVFEVSNLFDWLAGCERLLAVNPPADQLHAVFVVQGGRRFTTATEIQPAQLLIRRLVAAHDVAHELERRVLAGLIAATGHVAIDDTRGRRVEGLDRFHNGRGVEHLDLDTTAGHRLNVVDILRRQFAGHSFRGVVCLNAQFCFLRAHGHGRAGCKRRSDGDGCRLLHKCHNILPDIWRTSRWGFCPSFDAKSSEAKRRRPTRQQKNEIRHNFVILMEFRDFSR